MNSTQLKPSSRTRYAVRDSELFEAIESIQIRYVPHPDFGNPDEIHRILESSDFSSRTGTAPLVSTNVGVLIPEVDLLTPEEERSLFLRMNCYRHLAEKRRTQALRDGVRDVDLRTVQNLLAEANAVREQISHANQRLLLRLASRFRCNRNETQDFVGEASVILLQAIDRFDASLGFRFSTYATHSLQRHLYRVWQKSNRIPVPEADVSRIESDDETRWVDSEVEAMVPALLDELSDRERELLELRFGLKTDGKGLPYRELAERAGLSPERVRQIVLQACTKLRQKYSESVGLDA